ncbi:glycoside hydrolase superfamily [Gilbertella persicaria]|uniref:glycoside hydrolase superfamily n=1 Tax=Gilbertella persicaria TaxID=101096 RepID=UPI002220D827|nr:glycoside hydrolase superfamily [Gilbertella persicaria]KAI8086914.1 glycoside hydrolase superfamily [Gilbertella persicaria]
MLKLIYLSLTFIVLQEVHCVFNATSNSNVIYYWGQNSAGFASSDPNHLLWQKRLASYCDDDDKDIIVVSFLHQFGQGRSTSFDLANSSQDCKGIIPGTQLLHCPDMEAGRVKKKTIKSGLTISKRYQVLSREKQENHLVYGGATPAYGLGSAKEGEDLANELWETFGGGAKSDTARPFGTAIVDGFDLDIENGEKMGYTSFVNKMRQNYELDNSKAYYIAAAPQCPFPDYYVGDVLDNTWVDFVIDNGFNYDVWESWAKTKSMNKNVRLFVGIPGSPTAANRGYIPYTQLVNKINPLKSSPFFGGVMVWDISQAYANTADVLPNYASGVSRLIKETDDTAPVELAPITINTGTTTALESSSLSGSQPDLVYSTSQSIWTTTLKRNVTTTSTILVVSTLIDQPYESIVTSDQVITYTQSLPSSLDSITWTSNSVTPSALPIANQACDREGSLVCHDQFSFAQCNSGYWVVRDCMRGTVCREDHNINPPSIYCGYP